MKTFVCYIGLLITLALRLRATQFNSACHSPSSYIELGDRISNKVEATWKNQLDSFVDVVSTKIVDKLENEISNGNGLDNMMVLLEVCSKFLSYPLFIIFFFYFFFFFCLFFVYILFIFCLYFVYFFIYY
ncbi:gamete egress and sporozoite traversal protein, putative [Plasmodium malariae]|uniref:Gamete egress and sporozoite traversal protein, putative n=1 Tax=Plasmodium malariae TaxID=5858 RepID=A0A1C3L1N2_PLAMA|nr:gamete egress and sporozoite traversal protein, putative [Plasmodium malariae]